MSKKGGQRATVSVQLFSGGGSRSMDDVLDLDENKEESIRVCTRMRPLFPKEVEAHHIKAWKVEPNALHLIVEPPSQLEMEESRQAASTGKKNADGGAKKAVVEKSQGQKDVIQRHYVLDRCFDETAQNSEVFDYVAKDIVLDCFKGINGCVFAYGQTGSGKTHSIMGVADDPGILPRSLAEFFDCVNDPSLRKEEEQEVKRKQHETEGEGGDGGAADDEDKGGTTGGGEDAAAENTEYLMRVSYVEIYLERVNDLLQENPKGGAVENLEVKEDPKKGFVVVGLHEETVATMEEAMSLIAKAEQRRHFARTNFNETSSRSHVVFSITLESTCTFEDGSNVSRRGELKIVDLAGNEKAGRASEGVENARLVLEEGKAINKSLFLLSEVISKLSKQAQQLAESGGKLKKTDKEIYIPWRDSKLTRLLQKALGGNSRASVLVAIHPSNMYLDTSFSTLRFALKCKSIKKKICVNFFSPEQSLIAQQKKLIARLQTQLKALAGAGLFDQLPQRATPRPEDNEEVQQLKVDLENKINKFQQFIMKATRPSTPFGGAALARRKTLRGPQQSSGAIGGFRRLDTLAAAKQNLRTIDKLNSGDLYGTEVGGDRVNLSRAFNFLGRKASRTGRSSDGEGVSLPISHMDTIEPAIDAAVQELENIDDDEGDEVSLRSPSEGEETRSGSITPPAISKKKKRIVWREDTTKDQDPEMGGSVLIPSLTSSSPPHAPGRTSPSRVDSEYDETDVDGDRLAGGAAPSTGGEVGRRVGQGVKGKTEERHVADKGKVRGTDSPQKKAVDGTAPSPPTRPSSVPGGEERGEGGRIEGVDHDDEEEKSRRSEPASSKVSGEGVSKKEKKKPTTPRASKRKATVPPASADKADVSAIPAGPGETGPGVTAAGGGKKKEAASVTGGPPTTKDAGEHEEIPPSGTDGGAAVVGGGRAAGGGISGVTTGAKPKKKVAKKKITKTKTFTASPEPSTRELSPEGGTKRGVSPDKTTPRGTTTSTGGVASPSAEGVKPESEEVGEGESQKGLVGGDEEAGLKGEIGDGRGRDVETPSTTSTPALVVTRYPGGEGGGVEDEEEEDEDEVVSRLRGARDRAQSLCYKLQADKKDLAQKLKKAKALGLEAVSRLTYRFNTEHEAAKKLQERVYDLQAQSRYSSAILNRLGLSILSTSSVPDARLRRRQQRGGGGSPPLGEPEDEAGLEEERKEIFTSTTRLSDFIKALLSEQEKASIPGGKRGLLCLPIDRPGSHGADLSPDFFDFTSPGSGGFRGLVFPDVDQVKPLAYAMLSDVLARVMLMHIQASRVKDESSTGGGSASVQRGKTKLLGVAAGIMKGEGLRSLTSKGKAGIKEEDSEADEATYEEVEEVLGLKPSRSLASFSDDARASNELSEADEADLQATEGKRQRIVESVLSLLSPWEQNMLALLYEQQEMRRALGELRDHFVRRLRETQVRFKRAVLEKLEFSDHCERLLGAVTAFKQELQEKQDAKLIEEDTNAKFGKLMNKIEEISIKLGERNVEYRLLSEEYKQLATRNDELRATVDLLKEEKANLLVAPHILPHFEEINDSVEDPAMRSLGYDVCVLQRYASRLLVELEESRATEKDLRSLNAQLYTELSAANDCVHDLKSHINLTSIIHSKTLAGFKKQIAQLEDDVTEKSARIAKLQQEVADSQSRLAKYEGDSGDKTDETAAARTGAAGDNNKNREATPTVVIDRYDDRESGASSVSSLSRVGSQEDKSTADDRDFATSGEEGGPGGRRRSASVAHGGVEEKKKLKKLDGTKGTKSKGLKPGTSSSAGTKKPKAGGAAPARLQQNLVGSSRKSLLSPSRAAGGSRRAAVKTASPTSAGTKVTKGGATAGAAKGSGTSGATRKKTGESSSSYTTPGTSSSGATTKKGGSHQTEESQGASSSSSSQASSSSSSSAAPSTKEGGGGEAIKSRPPASPRDSKRKTSSVTTVGGPSISSNTKQAREVSSVSNHNNSTTTGAGTSTSSTPPITRVGSSGEKSKEVGKANHEEIKPKEGETATSSPSSPTPSAGASSPPQAILPPTVAGVPAFTGDPRDKGFGSMAAALSRRRKPAAS